MDLRSKRQSAGQPSFATTPSAFTDDGGVEKRIADHELRDLMIGYQGADSAACEQLVNRLSPRLLSFFANSGLSRSDAEDLLQECWMRIHRSRHTYRSSEPLLPWIFAIARHTRLDGYRKRRRLESREVLVDSIPEAIQPNRTLEPAEPDKLFRLVESLPESQREVIIMLKVTGMSLEEVARATSSTVGAVKQKAHRAYSRLRLLLEKE
jgi:RNA polymerase sigma-70 factor, ECF subfamily